MVKKALATQKTMDEIVGFLSAAEMKEVLYSIQKELAWKRLQLDQLGKGLLNNCKEDRIPKEIKSQEISQEDWLKMKIKVLTSTESKFKVLLRMRKSLEILNTVDNEKE